MNPILMELLINLAVFLELSGEDVVHPHSAAHQLEWIAYKLKQLSPEVIQTFVAFVQELAVRWQNEGSSTEVVDFVRSFPMNSGLIDES